MICLTPPPCRLSWTMFCSNFKGLLETQRVKSEWSRYLFDCSVSPRVLQQEVMGPDFRRYFIQRRRTTSTPINRFLSNVCAGIYWDAEELAAEAEQNQLVLVVQHDEGHPAWEWTVGLHRWHTDGTRTRHWVSHGLAEEVLGDFFPTHDHLERLHRVRDQPSEPREIWVTLGGIYKATSVASVYSYMMEYHGLKMQPL